MTDYPYMISNNKIGPIIAKIQTAARPKKFTIEVLRTLGFTSTNDRAFIPLFKKLGFLQDDGTPSPLYDQLKDATSTKTILGVQIKSLYSELFAINTEIYTATDTEVKGAISRVTGRDEDGVTRIYNTFKALCNLATFDVVQEQVSSSEKDSEQPTNDSNDKHIELPRMNEFHYNIQIHLPATNDISVYNAIFKSLKENLLMWGV